MYGDLTVLKGKQFAFHVACRGVCFVLCTLVSKYKASCIVTLSAENEERTRLGDSTTMFCLPIVYWQLQFIGAANHIVHMQVCYRLASVEHSQCAHWCQAYRAVLAVSRILGIEIIFSSHHIFFHHSQNSLNLVT